MSEPLYLCRFSRSPKSISTRLSDVLTLKEEVVSAPSLYLLWDLAMTTHSFALTYANATFFISSSVTDFRSPS